MAGFITVVCSADALAGHVRFAPPQNTSLDYMSGLLVADLIQNGNHDVVAFSSNDVYVLGGDGHGRFAKTNSYGGGFILSSVAAGHLNSDGLTDLVALDSSLSTLKVYMAANGDYESPVLHPVSSGATAVTLGDFNHDNRLDVVTANGHSGTVTVFFGDGEGGFLSAGQNHGVTGIPYSVTTADLDGDRNLDIVTCNMEGQALAVLYGDGNGNFEPARYLSVGGPPRSLVVADFDGDQTLDLACANSDSNTVSVLLQTGVRTFSSSTDSQVGNLPLTISAGDVNGDGPIDLVTANYGSSDVSVLLGNGDGTFSLAGALLTGGSPYAAALADMNNDGQTDIITANYNRTYSISMLLNRTKVALQTLSDPNGVKVRWPAYAIGAVLQSSPDLSSQSSWQSVTNSVIPEGDWNAITFSPLDGEKFWRLKLD